MKSVSMIYNTLERNMILENAITPTDSKLSLIQSFCIYDSVIYKCVIFFLCCFFVCICYAFIYNLSKMSMYLLFIYVYLCSSIQPF